MSRRVVHVCVRRRGVPAQSSTGPADSGWTDCEGAVGIQPESGRRILLGLGRVGAEARGGRSCWAQWSGKSGSVSGRCTCSDGNLGIFCSRLSDQPASQPATTPMHRPTWRGMALRFRPGLDLTVRALHPSDPSAASISTHARDNPSLTGNYVSPSCAPFRCDLRVRSLRGAVPLPVCLHASPGWKKFHGRHQAARHSVHAVATVQ